MTRRIAPVVATGGNQLGSNAGLSAQTGLPAMSVPEGFTAGGFSVGMELLGRPFAEPTLIGLAYSFEQGSRHRRAPAFAPSALRRGKPMEPGADAVAFDVTATGAFTATARFRFDSGTRALGFDIQLPSASLDRIGGVYLHRRTTRPNGGVAHILAKSPAPRVTGVVTLSDAEAADLKAGKLYLAVVARNNPRSSARGDLALAGG